MLCYSFLFSYEYLFIPIGHSNYQFLDKCFENEMVVMWVYVMIPNSLN